MCGMWQRTGQALVGCLVGWMLMGQTAAKPEAYPALTPADVDGAVCALVGTHGEAVREAAARGARQVARLWRKTDGSAADGIFLYQVRDAGLCGH